MPAAPPAQDHLPQGPRASQSRIPRRVQPVVSQLLLLEEPLVLLILPLSAYVETIANVGVTGSILRSEAFFGVSAAVI